MKYTKINIIICVILCTLQLRAQNPELITLSPIICDLSGKPINNAIVYGNEGKTISYTNALGNFNLKVTPNSMILIEAVGYKTLVTKAIRDLTQIVLEEGENDQLINIAHGKVKRTELLGAVSIMNFKESDWKDKNSNTIAAIDGKLAGLLWSNNIWGMGDAMIMIDGVPRSYDDIIFDEVDQISVLKGVGAVALYGSHAAKGVILITTKRGQAFKKIVNVRFNQGFVKPKEYPSYLNSVDYMTLYNEARKNDGFTAQFSDDLINKFRTGNKNIYPNVDYLSSDYLKNMMSNNNVAAEFSGGNDKAQFYTNIGWSSSNTLLKLGEGGKESDNRFNLRGNVDIKLSEFISSTIDFSAVYNNSRRANGDYWTKTSSMLPFRYSPLIPIDLIVKDSVDALLTANNSKNIIDGKYILGGSQEFSTTAYGDLVAAGYNNFISRGFQFTNGIDFDLRSLLKGLSLHTKLSVDYLNSYTQAINNQYTVYAPVWNENDSIVSLKKYGADVKSGSQNITNSLQKRNLSFFAKLDYGFIIDKLHSFNVSMLASANNGVKTAVYQPVTNSNAGLNINYNFDHKYLLELTGMMVHSTKLAEGNRVGFSPAVNAGWILSREKFLENNKNIDFLKLTASAGIINTDLDITDFYYYDSPYAASTYYGWADDYYVNQTTSTTHGENPLLTFVKRKEINVGIDGVFFNKLLTAEATFFQTTMDGLPTQRFSKYPSYFKSFVPYENYNSNTRQGFDINLQLNKRIGEVDINIGAIGTFVKSEVVNNEEIYENSYQSRIGKPTDVIFGLQSAGFFYDSDDVANHETQSFGTVQPGDIKYIDQNDDGVINEYDEVMLGQWTAPLTYSLNFAVTFKNLTLYAMGTGNNGGAGIKGSAESSRNYYWVDGNDKYSTEVLGRWTEDTKNTATYPRLSSLSNSNNFRTSDFWMYSTDRFNLSKVQLTYTFSRKLLKNSFVRELNIYVNGSNLLTLSKNKDILDLNVGSSPQCRYFNVGLSSRF